MDCVREESDQSSRFKEREELSDRLKLKSKNKLSNEVSRSVDRVWRNSYADSKRKPMDGESNGSATSVNKKSINLMQTKGDDQVMKCVDHVKHYKHRVQFFWTKKISNALISVLALSKSKD